MTEISDKAAAAKAPRVVFFLGGQSYPQDRPVEHALRTILARPHSQFLTQTEILAHAGARQPPASLAERLALLHQVVSVVAQGRDIFLAGRSAGARAVSVFAGHHPVRAVICIAYPFREPGLVLEPDRFVHLASLTTPTLLIQAENDEYGGREITETYAFSAAITLRLRQGGHQIALTDTPTRRMIRHFVAQGWRHPPPPDPQFDEAFYLARYTDVARAVAAGTMASGQDHYRRWGRAEGRAFRLLPAMGRPAASQTPPALPP